MEGDSLEKGHFFETLSALNDSQFAYMLRMALAGNRYSNKADNIDGWCLAAVAEAAGLNVEAIRQAQQQIAQARQERTAERISVLEKHKTKLAEATIAETPSAA